MHDPVTDGQGGEHDAQVRFDRLAFVVVDRAGGVSLPPGQSTSFGLQLAVDRLGRTGQADVAVAFDRGLALRGALGFGDLVIDPA